ncbi:MAG TPA: serine/threonine protein phosphatase [Thermotogaceae bacterium]|nr:serine/threonine protein phosphatase [Thermotogaceae bacterium]
MSTYVIGDIHGCFKSLRNLIDILPLKSDDKLIFLGDYIDRGPNSKEVVEFLIQLSKSYECVFIRGNHEQMLLDSFKESVISQIWYFNGAAATLKSYGGISKIPTSHMDFFVSTKYYHIIENLFFVHAGVKPKVALENQRLEDFLWIRDEFIYSDDPLPGFKIIFGHTPFEKPLILPDKIGLDTGCVYGGNLSCLCLEENTIFQVPCSD